MFKIKFFTTNTVIGLYMIIRVLYLYLYLRLIITVDFDRSKSVVERKNYFRMQSILKNL